MPEMKKLESGNFAEDRIEYLTSNSDRTRIVGQGVKKHRISIKNEIYPKNNVLPLPMRANLHYEPVSEEERELPYREAVCDLCEKTVSLALSVPLASLRARTRCTAEIALARQIAMYLSHTTFSLLLTEIGLHFGRDRSTVAHACSVVEDKRDDMTFDVLMCQLEALLNDAREAMGICIMHGRHYSQSTGRESISGLSAYRRSSRGELI